jgi:hypothetical protein
MARINFMRRKTHEKKERRTIKESKTFQGGDYDYMIYFIGHIGNCVGYVIEHNVQDYLYTMIAVTRGTKLEFNDYRYFPEENVGVSFTHKIMGTDVKIEYYIISIETKNN